LTMLLGIAEFSRALYAYHYVSSTAREATRFAAVRGSTCTSDNSCAKIVNSADIQTFAQNAPLGIDGSQITATATWPVQVSSPTVCNTVPNSPGCTVQVTVSYTFNFLFPFVSKSSIAMTSTSQMVISH
jgi:Flp pilus assembly protein TadG